MTQPGPDVVIRPAHEDDLPRIWGIRYANEIVDLVEPPAAGAPPASLRHVLDLGTLLVAARSGWSVQGAGSAKPWGFDQPCRAPLCSGYQAGMAHRAVC